MSYNPCSVYIICFCQFEICTWQYSQTVCKVIRLFNRIFLCEKNKVPLIPDLVNCISYSVLPPWYKFKSNVYNIFQHSIFSVNQQVFKSIQINCRYKAEYLFNKLRLRFSHLGILTFKHQVLAKGQGEDAERYLPSRQIGWDLGGHHAGVRSCHIQVNIKVRCQRIDNLFPTLDFLHLVEEQMGFPIGRKTLFKLCVHLLCRYILVGKPVLPQNLW